MRILITGVSGSGKTTVITALKKGGHRALDLDDIGVCTYINKQTGKPAEYIEGAGREWIETHRWEVIIPKLTDILDTYQNGGDVFVGGKVARIQLDDMKKIFDIIYLLKPHDSIIDERLRSRTTNRVNFAKTKEERNTIIRNRHDFERASIDAGAITLDNHGTVQELVNEILNAPN